MGKEEKHNLAADASASPRSQEEGLMPLIEHLGELRKRLIWVLLVLFAGLIIGLFLAEPIYRFLVSREPVKGMQLHAFSLWDGVGIYMKFAFAIALVPTVPFAFYQLWSFIKPALKANERSAALRYVPYALFMLLLGFAFAYFVVFPMAFTFTTKVSRGLGLEDTYGVVQYFTFMFNILVPVTLLFLLPLLIMFLTELRIVTPAGLKKFRRIAYFIMIFIGVVITPPDLVSDIIVAIPLLLLYELSVFMSVRIYKRQKAAEERFEQEFGT